MQPYSLEQSIIEGEIEVKELFDYVKKNAANKEAHEIEQDIFSKLMKIGLASMKCYFAEKGTGDIGDTLKLNDGVELKKENKLRERAYFSVFGKLQVPRTCYRIKGKAGIVPLDVQANLPKRCYSYILQKLMNLCSIRESFSESNITLVNLLGIDISTSCYEVVNQESVSSYDEFYEGKDLPDPESEGSIQVVEFDGKGVPIIKEEAAKIISHLGKGEKRQKKKKRRSESVTQ